MVECQSVESIEDSTHLWRDMIAIDQKENETINFHVTFYNSTSLLGQYERM